MYVHCTFQVVVFCTAEQFKNPQMHPKSRTISKICVSHKKSRTKVLIFAFPSTLIIFWSIVWYSIHTYKKITSPDFPTLSQSIIFQIVWEQICITNISQHPSACSGILAWPVSLIGLPHAYMRLYDDHPITAQRQIHDLMMGLVHV